MQQTTTTTADSSIAGTSRLRMIVAALFACLLCILLIFGLKALAARHFKSDSAPGSQMSSRRSIEALATITPEDAVLSLTAPASSGESRLERLFVHENDLVTAGQTVAVLDSAGRLAAGVRQAQATLAAKQAALNRTLAGASPFELAAQSARVQQDQADLDQKQRDLDRYKQAFAQNAVSASDLEQHTLALETARKQLQNATDTLHQLGEVRGVDVAVSRADVESARTAVEEARAALSQAYVRAPQTGTVLAIHTHAGEKVGTAGVLDLAPSAHTYAVAEVFETDIAHIMVGQRATVTASALSAELHGTVERIGRSIERQQTVNTDPAANTDARVVRVWILLDAPSTAEAQKKINLQVTVRFE